MIALVSLLVHSCHLLLVLAIVLAVSSMLLLHLMGWIHRAILIPGTGSFFSMWVVVGRCLGLTFGAVSKFLLGWNILIDVFLFQIDKLDAHILRVGMLTHFGLSVIGSFIG